MLRLRSQLRPATRDFQLWVTNGIALEVLIESLGPQ